MAEQKLPYLKRAAELRNIPPRPADLLAQLDELAQRTGATTPQARMIGITMSSVIMDMEDEKFRNRTASFSAGHPLRVCLPAAFLSAKPGKS
ncbi:hypothetical protein [Pantoea sp. 1.19]|uniref:hypothetical protein n=1 Tax=Pantoea sp. 1.19 TaxID=1925589 RepID=UPI000948B763|nr:hypothetical protein [Pantoea sp. 1.19]